MQKKKKKLNKRQVQRESMVRNHRVKICKKKTISKIQCQKMINFSQKKENYIFHRKKTIDQIRIVKNLQNRLTRFEENGPIT